MRTLDRGSEWKLAMLEHQARPKELQTEAMR